MKKNFLYKKFEDGSEFYIDFDFDIKKMIKVIAWVCFIYFIFSFIK